ncbi:hypothetical protein M514_10508 [Trichuris suis]|uniref:Secreted protein n=1 Tax=Trichuris suis TaxID=68888 RepID=A0A085LUK7_9BILA|nr:hypothetical protein M513_10508 [Trichuris suis]KFD62237.1 hypothetical protein M514_10508 [Trichuris suis]
MMSTTQLLITLVTITCYADLKKVSMHKSLKNKEVFTSEIYLKKVSRQYAPVASKALLNDAVKESLLAMAKEDASTAARLIRITDVINDPDDTSLFYAKFIAAYTTCKADSKVKLEDIYSTRCPVDVRRERLSCSGYIESSGERTGQRLYCEPAETFETTRL